jgi:hypothetical protein
MNKRNVFSLGLLGQKASAASFGQCHYIPHCTGSYIARATASRQPSYRWRRTVSDIDGWKLRSRRQVREKAVRCRITPRSPKSTMRTVERKGVPARSRRGRSRLMRTASDHRHPQRSV